MTHQERMVFVRKAWNVLGLGGILCIVDTPNRLWYHDGDTSMLDYFHWLPDDLALEYSRFSPRRGFNEHYRSLDEASKSKFLRTGRGFSFHELELAIKPIKEIEVVSCMSSFLRRRNILDYLAWRFSFSRVYELMLRRISPDVHPGFLQPKLYLAIRKNWTSGGGQHPQDCIACGDTVFRGLKQGRSVFCRRARGFWQNL